jgi:hypothetical protein
VRPIRRCLRCPRSVNFVSRAPLCSAHRYFESGPLAGAVRLARARSRGGLSSPSQRYTTCRGRPSVVQMRWRSVPAKPSRSAPVTGTRLGWPSFSRTHLRLLILRSYPRRSSPVRFLCRNRDSVDIALCDQYRRLLVELTRVRDPSRRTAAGGLPPEASRLGSVLGAMPLGAAYPLQSRVVFTSCRSTRRGSMPSDDAESGRGRRLSSSTAAARRAADLFSVCGTRISLRPGYVPFRRPNYP